MIFAAVAAAVFCGDFVLKKYAQEHMGKGKAKRVCKGRILLHRYYNHGAALNFLEKCPGAVRNLCGGLLLAVGISWALLLRRKDNPGLLLGLSLLLGGGGSNFYDRITKGYVVDYFSFRTPWKWLNQIVFNLSDFCIFVGSILVAVARK
ncbi:MAG: signal peptidase II [Lachnospiraceae bacterium]|nr:signal peptidase II [Lachnospiraceae bacterium]